ncbi:MAG: hypothetical protein LBU79_06595, partial [Planctomycetota bacterium]|nr:hypothetical protein [Planctomycetota bacterium]
QFKDAASFPVLWTLSLGKTRQAISGTGRPPLSLKGLFYGVVLTLANEPRLPDLPASVSLEA